MNKNINRKNRAMTIQTIRRVSVFLLIIGVMSSCSEENLDDNAPAVGGHTLTLRVAPTVAPISEARATVRAASPDSEAAAAGFSYELVSSDHADSTTTEVFTATVTKAVPTKLKNVYALLFTSTGAFNGRASVGNATVNSEDLINITFTDVKESTASGCRLVIVANDHNATSSYAHAGGEVGSFSKFSGTYGDFQKLTMTNTIAKDADIPYAGTATVDLRVSDIDNLVKVSLYRTLASVTLKNSFKVTGMTFSGVAIHNAGGKHFAPVGDKYDGSASKNTPSENLVAGTSVPNASSGDNFYFYVGENVRPLGDNRNVRVPADRNFIHAPANSSYLRITSDPFTFLGNSPKNVGDEHIIPGSKRIEYDIYLGKSSDVKDFSLRRHTNYTITSYISGTIKNQETLANIDNRVSESFVSGGSCGLVIGKFGGFTGTGGGTGTKDALNVSGSYTKLLILQPNNSRSSVNLDNIRRIWSTSNNTYQPDARRFWSKEYIYNIKAGNTVGGMSTGINGIYNYCYNLDVGGVAKGTWYIPTLAQQFAINAVLASLRLTGHPNYVGFYFSRYWSCTEDHPYAHYMDIFDGSTHDERGRPDKSYSGNVRCVRDL